MDEALRLLLTNAVLAGVLALVAWITSRLTKRQAVVHGLWLLALLKLVTPPLVELPLLPARGAAAAEAARSVLADEARPAAPAALLARPVVTAPPATSSVAAPVAGTLVAPSLEASSPARRASPGGEKLEPARARSEATARGAARARRLALPVLLALGASLVAGLAAVRFLRFRRLAAATEPAPSELAARAAEIGAALGLRRVPSISLLAARVPPMVWPASPRPRLLLPRDLLPDLDADERDALLAHELAHVRRRDHWVRFLEVGATALFWWYPVAWWSRRALRRAEERCCDEWVVRALPDSAQAYASGILKSLTFLAEEPVALPETASGAGPIRDLESRLKEILMTSPRPRLSRPIRFALGALAVGALALFPTLAPPRAAEAAAVAVPQDTDRTAPPTPSAQVAAPALAPPAPPPAASARPHAPAPLAPPSPVAAPDPPERLTSPPLAPDARPAAGPDDELDPAFEAERRALDDQRRQLHLSQLELERHAVELEARIESQARAGEVARLRAEGYAQEAARAERRGALATRRVGLDKRRIEFQVQQVRLEADAERAAMGAEGEQAVEAKRPGAGKAEQELEKKQQTLEAEEEKLERETQALEAEERVHEARGATEDLAKSLAEQIESLRETLPEAGAHRAELEREIEKLEAAFGALKGAAPNTRSPRPAVPPVK